MPRKEILPIKSPITWVLVADGKQAQIYKNSITEKIIPIRGDYGHPRYKATLIRELLPVNNMEWQAEPDESYEKGRNKPATIPENSSTARHIAEPHAYIKDNIRKNFAKHIADQINGASINKMFNNLIMVAPAKMLGDLKKNLEEHTLKKIRIEYPKDLTHYAGKDLIKHLKM